MSDDWWAAAAGHPLLAIGSHGWDHNHPDLDPGDARRGGFTGIDTLEACRRQVEQAAQLIRERCGTWPELFAYPFGESSPYLRECYFPVYAEAHRSRAAFGTHPGALDRATDRWNLPRLVCGRDWQHSAELLDRLGGSPAAS